MEERTTDSILEFLNNAVTEKQPLSPHYWVEAAKYLNVLIGDENAKLFRLKQEVSKEKIRLLEEECKSVAEAKLRIEATDIYREAKVQEAKIEQITEYIRLAKLQARLSNDEIKNY